MIRTILLPWDGSEPSRRALDFLLRLLRCCSWAPDRRKVPSGLVMPTA